MAPNAARLNADPKPPNLSAVLQERRVPSTEREVSIKRITNLDDRTQQEEDLFIRTGTRKRMIARVWFSTPKAMSVLHFALESVH
jgi:hypothetical protein